MSLISFMKDVGEKLFAPRGASAGSSAAPAADQQTQDVANGATIKKYIESLGLNVTGLEVKYDSATFTATISGTAADKETREKVVVAAGNVLNVAKVDDKMTVTSDSGADAKFHTVEKGDTLSKIAKQEYGDANKYNKIFEANKPMLKSADLIYPGQVLRIPA
ncbi:MAG: peptidoglycan-binding protein LysM [Betaproteobacteria bacterium]